MTASLLCNLFIIYLEQQHKNILQSIPFLEYTYQAMWTRGSTSLLPQYRVTTYFEGVGEGSKAKMLLFSLKHKKGVCTSATLPKTSICTLSVLNLLQ